MCDDGTVGVLTAMGIKHMKYGKCVANRSPEMVMPSDRWIATQARPTAHRPSLYLAIGMYLQITSKSVSVEGAMKKTRTRTSHLEWWYGKPDRSMLRHLAFQVVVEIVCSLNQRQGMRSAGMSDGVLRT